MKHNGLRTLVLVAAVAVVLVGVSPFLHAQGEAAAPGEATQMSMQSQADPGAIQQAIQDQLNKNVNFAESDLVATVSDNSVVLRGNVRDEVEHARALEIAREQAGDRRVIDQTTIQQVYETVR